MPVLDHYVRFNHCRAILPWFPYARGQGLMSRFRRTAAELEGPPDQHRFHYRLIAGLLFGPIALRQVLIAWSGRSVLTRREHGVGRFTQLIDLLYWTIGLNYPAYAYYMQRVVVRRDRKTWCRYVDHHEHLAVLTHHVHRWDTRICFDKLALHHRLDAAGIPTIPVLLAADAGRIDPAGGPGVPERGFPHDLLIKPATGKMEEGVEFWRHHADTGMFHLWHHRSKLDPSPAESVPRAVSFAELIEHLRMRSLEQPMLLQRWLRNAPEAGEISPHFLLNFRVVTALIDDRVTVISAICRMGFDRTTLPNNSYLANIDVATGVLGPATSRNREFGYGDVHLQTGQPVRGRRIARWDEIKHLAIRAHRFAAGVPSIGWDVIDTDSGLYIMEANLYWGVDISQVAGPFLGETLYPAAVLAAIA